MPVHDELGKRMKSYYETVPKIKLMRRTPVIVRIDGKAFHTFTKGFNTPFDEILINSMQETMKCLCESIQGCVLGYHQSDEISLLLIDYQNLNTAAWFDYEVQKMCSISASIATLAFNRMFSHQVSVYFSDNVNEYMSKNKTEFTEKLANYYNTIFRASDTGAMFDARVFNIPKEEVTNYFYWRQLDASRNSVQMVGQHYFSHKQLMHKSCSNIQDMLMENYNVNWNDFPAYQKRGSCCYKENYLVDDNGNELPKDDLLGSLRSRWVIDKEIPIFKGDGRSYIDKFIEVEN